MGVRNIDIKIQAENYLVHILGGWGVAEWRL
jgi:hypothetical protein